jgi:cyclophilin family peptidyl-prolyl cis-trans isomerase
MKKILLLLAILGNMIVLAQKPKVTPKNKPIKKPIKELKEYVKISTNFGDMIFVLYDETPKHRDNFKKLIKQKYYDDLLFHRIIRDFMIQGGDPESRNADSLKMLGNSGPGYTIPAEFNRDIIHTKGALAAARTGDDINPNKESSGSQFYIVQGKKLTKKELEEIMNGRNYQRKQQVFNKMLAKDSSIANNLSLIQQTQGNDAVQKYITQHLGPAIDDVYKKEEYIYNGNQINAYTQLGGTPFLDQDYTVFGQMISGFDVLDKIAIVYTNPQTNRPFIDVKMKISIIKK